MIELLKPLAAPIVWVLVLIILGLTLTMRLPKKPRVPIFQKCSSDSTTLRGLDREPTIFAVVMNPMGVGA